MPGSCNHWEKIEAKCVLSSCMLYAYIQHIKSDIPREVLHTLHICIQLRGGEDLSLLVYLLSWASSMVHGTLQEETIFCNSTSQGMVCKGPQDLGGVNSSGEVEILSIETSSSQFAQNDVLWKV